MRCRYWISCQKFSNEMNDFGHEYLQKDESQMKSNPPQCWVWPPHFTSLFSATTGAPHGSQGGRLRRIIWDLKLSQIIYYKAKSLVLNPLTTSMWRLLVMRSFPGGPGFTRIFTFKKSLLFVNYTGFETYRWLCYILMPCQASHHLKEKGFYSF